MSVVGTTKKSIFLRREAFGSTRRWARSDSGYTSQERFDRKYVYLVSLAERDKQTNIINM
jgi:hypothetical protein